MAIVPSPSSSTIQIALRAFLLALFPTGVEVIQGQDDRVPEPASTDFIVMTPILRERISTNIDAFADVAFYGSIAGTTLTVTSMKFGAILPGSTLYGAGIGAGTTIVGAILATGGVGTYLVSSAQSVASAELAAGSITLLQATKVTFQLDVHSANVGDSTDMAQTISTAFRDDIATSFFANLGYRVTPLYADDPKQVPFFNAEQNFETRWIIDAVLQANIAIAWPQQFMDSASITFKPVL